ncbi:MAG TPA: adenylate/guanylate cyclase domain-containing protein, partial [Vicinamibacteria bacterium]|nr:adenylate/guanylate cyclase domain-containing protein [Vicinamibacteria bacterium]
LREPSDLPIIMITAKDRTDDVVGALNMGANDYIVKPLDLPEVVARVKTQLQLKRAVSDLQQAKDEITLLKDDLEKRNQLIQRTFGQYLSAEVVSTILTQPPGVLRGEKRMVTLLMSDLRGFTTLAERHSPEQVVALLNNYLGGMADVITRYQGIIDEFIGDAIMALFGAPVGREDDAERAAACAVAMQIAMADVNEKNRRDGLPEIEMGVAVHTGEVIVGSIGSETRAKYGVVGTNVNLTSRIQSFTLGGQVLVSDATWRAAPDTIQVDQAPPLHARGFPEPIRVHDLTGVAGRHDLKLPPVPEVLRPLRRPIAVSLSVLQGKQRTPVESEGRMVQASDKWALVLCDPAPPAMTNLSVRVRHPDGAEVPGEVYAKVVGPAPGGVRIRFTSYAPEIALLLQETVVPGDATS